MFNVFTKLFQSIFPSGIVGNSIRSKQNALLGILSIAHSQRLDPKTLIQNLAAEHPGRYGKKLMLLQRWIAADSSMSAAIAHTPGVLDEEDALAIQCGIETNTLDETFTFLLDRNERDEQSTTGDIVRGTLGYVLAVLCFSILVGTFLMVFIVPTFAKIFDEFELALPPLMTALIAFSDYFAAILPIALMVALGMGFLLLFDDVRRGIVHSPLGRLIPTTITRRSAGLLRLLALPTQQGRSIGPTLTAAAQFHPDRRCRKQILSARADAKDESDIWRQLAYQRLISKNQAEQIGNIDSVSLRAWTLKTLAGKQRGQALRKAEFLARVLQHVPIIVLGIFVGWIAIAVMQTLTDLVRSLAY